MNQEEWRQKQIWQFVKHKATPSDKVKVDEELAKLTKHQHKQKGRKQQLLDAELKRRPGLLDDLELIRVKWNNGVYDDDHKLSNDVALLRNNYTLNLGWIVWISHYLRTGKSDSSKLILFRSYQRDGSVCTERYFPLNGSERKRLEQEAVLLEYETLGCHKQTQKGGAPEGRRSKTLTKYKDIVNSYYKSLESNPEISQDRFCAEAGISRSTLSRALKFVSENRS